MRLLQSSAERQEAKQIKQVLDDSVFDTVSKPQGSLMDVCL